MKKMIFFHARPDGSGIARYSDGTVKTFPAWKILHWKSH